MEGLWRGWVRRAGRGCAAGARVWEEVGAELGLVPPPSGWPSAGPRALSGKGCRIAEDEDQVGPRWAPGWGWGSETKHQSPEQGLLPPCDFPSSLPSPHL